MCLTAIIKFGIPNSFLIKWVGLRFRCNATYFLIACINRGSR